MRALRTSLSDTVGENTMTRSPTSSLVSSSACMSFPFRMIPPTSAPLGNRKLPTLFPAGGVPIAISASISSFAEPASDISGMKPPEGSSCSITFMSTRVDEMVSSMPSVLKTISFFGLLTRAITRGVWQRSFASWQITRFFASSPVTAISASARLQPASICARPSSAGAFITIEPSLSWTKLARRRSASMTVTSCPDSRSACERWNPTSPAPATTKYNLASLHGFVDHVGLVRERLSHEDLADLPILLQHRVEERAEDCRPREGVDAQLAVGLRAHRLVDLGDYLLHAEDLLRDLSAHEVAVVTFGQREDRVGPFDAGLAQHLEIGPVTEDRFAFEGAGQVLEPRPLRARRTGRGNVHHAHAMALGVEESREEATHPTATDDYDVHLVSS